MSDPANDDFMIERNSAKSRTADADDVLVFAPCGWDASADALSKLRFAYRDRWKHCQTCNCNLCPDIRQYVHIYFQMPIYLLTFSRLHKHRSINAYVIWRGLKMLWYTRRNRKVPILW